MNIEKVIDEMRGFVSALRILCGEQAIIFVSCYEMKDGLDTSVEQYIENETTFSFKNKGYVSYGELLPLIKEGIFNKFDSSVGPAVKNDLEWNLIEYYGLVSTMENEENPFNPLVSEKSVLLEVSSPDYEVSLCFVTPIGHHIIVTMVGKCT